MSDSRSKISDFLTHNHLGVLATSDNSGKPHASTVYLVNDSDLNIFFITKQNTQKYKNLQQNPKASMAVYEPKSQTTLQVDGQAEPDDDPQRFMNVFTQILKASMDLSEGATPPVSKLKAGEYQLYKLSPESMRLAEYSKPEHGDMSDMFDVVNF